MTMPIIPFRPVDDDQVSRLPLPQTFLELVAAICLGLALIFMLIAFIPRAKKRFRRWSFIFLALVVTLLIPSWVTAILAIFLIGTEVTDENVLVEVIKAIFNVTDKVRNRGQQNVPLPPPGQEPPHDDGGSPSGPGQKSPIDPSPASPSQETSTKELLTGELRTSLQPEEVSTYVPTFKDVPFIDRPFDVEHRVISILQAEFGRTFESNLRVVLKGTEVEVDGYSQGDGTLPDIFLEVKILKPGVNFNGIFKVLERFCKNIDSFRIKSKRSAIGVIAFVVEKKDAHTLAFADQVRMFIQRVFQFIVNVRLMEIGDLAV